MKTVGDLRAALEFMPDSARLVARSVYGPKWFPIVTGKITSDMSPDRRLTLILEIDSQSDAI